MASVTMPAECQQVPRNQFRNSAQIYYSQNQGNSQQRTTVTQSFAMPKTKSSTKKVKPARKKESWAIFQVVSSSLRDWRDADCGILRPGDPILGHRNAVTTLFRDHFRNVLSGVNEFYGGPCANS
jgi:hypothetical protein